MAELLVHVSGKQQDERYRCMAEAYEDFEIERTLDLTGPQLIEDSIGDVTITPRAITREGDELATNVTAPALVTQPASNLNHEGHLPIFSNLSPLFPTAALELVFTGTGLPNVPQATHSQDESQLRFISDTPLAIKALESQLWTSSLALAHEEEARAIAASLLPSPDSEEVEGSGRSPARSPSSMNGAVKDTVTMIRPAAAQLDRPVDDDFTPTRHSQVYSSRPSSLKRKRPSEEHEGGSRRASGMSLTQEIFGLRPREPSSSPGPPSPVAASIFQLERDILPDKAAGPFEPPSTDPMTIHDQSRSASKSSKAPAGVTAPAFVSNTQQHQSAKIAPMVAAKNEAKTSLSHSSKQPQPLPNVTSEVVKAHTMAVSVAPAAIPVPAKAQLPPPSPTISLPAQHHFIRPPSPPASLAVGPTSSSSSSTTRTSSLNITPPLQHLYNKFSLVQPPRYLPTQHTRPLRPLERGYWYLPAISTTRIWEANMLQDFWSFLEEFIRGGQAGWGVSCVRVPLVAEENDARSDNTMSEEQQERRCNVRVYCWGEVVEHIYYLLFVASRSKVKNAGLRWVDGEGKIVVVMPE